MESDGSRGLVGINGHPADLVVHLHRRPPVLLESCPDTPDGTMCSITLAPGAPILREPPIKLSSSVP